jgi:hypothetical protein
MSIVAAVRRADMRGPVQDELAILVERLEHAVRKIDHPAATNRPRCGRGDNRDSWGERRSGTWSADELSICSGLRDGKVERSNVTAWDGRCLPLFRRSRQRLEPGIRWLRSALSLQHDLS